MSCSTVWKINKSLARTQMIAHFFHSISRFIIIILPDRAWQIILVQIEAVIVMTLAVPIPLITEHAPYSLLQKGQEPYKLLRRSKYYHTHDAIFFFSRII